VRNEPFSVAWTLTKGKKRAVCQVWLHPLGVELRLVVDGESRQRMQVCATREELEALQQHCREALNELGWKLDDRQNHR
jgi:hypothetical protein